MKYGWICHLLLRSRSNEKCPLAFRNKWSYHYHIYSPLSSSLTHPFHLPSASFPFPIPTPNPKGYYTKKPINRADGFVVQMGDADPAGTVHGYVPPGSKEERKIPLEISLKVCAMPFLLFFSPIFFSHLVFFVFCTFFSFLSPLLPCSLAFDHILYYLTNINPLFLFLNFLESSPSSSLDLYLYLLVSPSLFLTQSQCLFFRRSFSNPSITLFCSPSLPDGL